MANDPTDSTSAPELEDGIDDTLRRYKAAYAAVVNKFPQAALQIRGKIAVLERRETATGLRP
jgi:hypothetical protein